MNHYIQITRQARVERKTIKVKAGTESAALNKAKDEADEWPIDIGIEHTLTYDVIPALNKAKKNTVTYRVCFRAGDVHRIGVVHVPAKLHESGWSPHPSHGLRFFIEQELLGYLKNAARLSSFNFTPWNIEEI